MNLNKFTQRSIDAVSDAQQMAQSEQHPQVTRKQLFSIGFAILLIACFWIWSPQATGSTFCQQTIELVGKTSEDTSRLFFYEYVAGECSGYRIYEIRMLPESLLSVNSWWQQSLTLPLLADSIEKKVQIEIAERLSVKNGKFGIYFWQDLFGNPKTGWEENKLIIDSLKKHGGAPPKKIQSPDFYVEANLIYSMPGGLYLNYEIQDAYFYRASNILFIVTRQPAELTMADTMHGVLIYKIKEEH